MDELGLPWSAMCKLACRSFLTGASMDALVYQARQDRMQWMLRKIQQMSEEERKLNPPPKMKRQERRLREGKANGNH